MDRFCNIADKGKSTVVVALEDQHHTGQKRVVPVSPVLDYIWRPVEYENTCVYDWIRLNHKRLIPKSRRKVTKPQQPAENDDSEFEDTYHVDEQIPTMDYHKLDSDCDEVQVAEMSEGEYETLTLCGGAVCNKDSESEDELLLTTASNKRLQKESAQAHSKHKKSAYCSSHIKHPQAHTHEVCLLDETEGFVPNFIGGSLPRKDAGSREEYCMTMLTLFKPWRTGKDLRLNENITWDDTFADYAFTERKRL